MDDYAGALALKILEQISFHPQNDSEAKLANLGLTQKLLNAESTALLKSFERHVKNSSEANSKDDVVSSDCFPLPKQNDKNASDTELSNEIRIIFQRRLLSMKRAAAQTISECLNESYSPDNVLDAGQVSAIIADFLQDAKKTDELYLQKFEQLHQMRNAYVKELKKCAEKAKCIEEMISTKEIEEMHDAIDNCRLKAQALALKLRLAKLVLLVKRYSPEEMEHLQLIQALQSQREQQLLKRKWMAQRTLDSFHSVDGKEFQGLLKEYGELQARIQHQRWMLDEMSRLKHDD